MSTPVVINGHVYMHLGNQRVDCIDLESGESRWRSESFGRYWTMTYRGDKILALDETGRLYLLRANPEHESAYYAYGQVLLQLGRPGDAQTAFETHAKVMAKQKPTSPMAHGE